VTGWATEDSAEVNDHPVTRHVLADADVIAFGWVACTADALAHPVGRAK
jgi:hypothetical protein